MNFRMMTVALLFIGFAGHVQASQVVCSGKYMGFVNFVVRGNLNSSHTSVRGDITVEAKGNGVNESGRLTPTSSSIRFGDHVRFAGQNADGDGSVEATYNAANKNYPGTLRARNGTRNVQVGVVCVLDLNRHLEPDLELDPNSLDLFRSELD